MITTCEHILCVILCKIIGLSKRGQRLYKGHMARPQIVLSSEVLLYRVSDQLPNVQQTAESKIFLCVDSMDTTGRREINVIIKLKKIPWVTHGYVDYFHVNR